MKDGQYHFSTTYFSKDESLWSSQWCLIRTHQNHLLYLITTKSILTSNFWIVLALQGPGALLWVFNILVWLMLIAFLLTFQCLQPATLCLRYRRLPVFPSPSFIRRVTSILWTPPEIDWTIHIKMNSMGPSPPREPSIGLRRERMSIE